jgi:hypothetical protein
MAGHDSKRVNASLRFQAASQSRFGMVLLHIQEQQIDLKREAELLLEARFLPFAIRRVENSSLALEVAYDCISRLEGMARMIREFYQISSVCVDPQTSSLHLQQDEHPGDLRAPPSNRSEPSPPVVHVKRGGQIFGNDLET